MGICLRLPFSRRVRRILGFFKNDSERVENKIFEIKKAERELSNTILEFIENESGMDITSDESILYMMRREILNSCEKRSGSVSLFICESLLTIRNDCEEMSIMVRSLGDMDLVKTKDRDILWKNIEIETEKRLSRTNATLRQLKYTVRSERMGSVRLTAIEEKIRDLIVSMSDFVKLMEKRL